MQQVDLRLPEWVGAIEVETTGQGGLKPWRLPLALLDFLDERTRFQAGNPSGVRLRFASSTRRLVLAVEPEPKQKRWFDLVADGRLAGRVELPPEVTDVVFSDLSAGEKVLELWLNHMYAPVIVRSLRVDDGDLTFRAVPQTKPRILFHGSSISHGRQAAGPTESWTVGAARLAGLDPVNLGVGGACRLEPAVARVIRGMPADYLSFCFGINVVSGYAMNARAFRAGVIGFIQIVREGHPGTPLAIQGPIFCRPFEQAGEKLTFSLEQSRGILREVVDCFRRHGDSNILYGGDLAMLGEADEGLLLADAVHPGEAGHRLMSRRYVEQVWPRLRNSGDKDPSRHIHCGESGRGRR